jgi:hypothetical protein
MTKIKVINGRAQGTVTLYDDETEDIILTCSADEYMAWSTIKNTIAQYNAMKTGEEAVMV